MTRWCAVTLLAVLLCLPVAAGAQEPPQQGWVIEPSFWLSTFVTDKGSLTRELADNQGSRELDVHTGSFNWVVNPSLFSGYAWGDWVGGLRLSYPVQFAHLDLPLGEIADGVIQSLELGPEFSYRLFSWRYSTMEIQFGAAARFLSVTDLEYQQGGETAEFGSRDLRWSTALSGWSVQAGFGGDLMRGEHVLLGWLFRFYWGRHEMTGDEDTTYGDPPVSVDHEDLSLDVYSAFVGVRLRIFPLWTPPAAPQP